MRVGGWEIGITSPTPVAEYEAEGEIDRVYNEIKQSLRVTGVNLVFRTWAGLGGFLPALWDQVRPNVETAIFDRAADAVREQAGREAPALAPPAAPEIPGLGESSAYQIRAALDLYQYINPKLLVLVCAVRQALQGESATHTNGRAAETAPRGAPAKMVPMEMESEKPNDKELRRIFKDIQKTLSLPSVHSDYRTLALWPEYLAAAWKRLKPICKHQGFSEAADRLRRLAQEQARQLPYPVALSLGQARELSQSPDQVLETTKKFEFLLPGLILNMAILHQDWNQRAERPASAVAPAPVPTVNNIANWRTFQNRLRMLELDDQFVSYIDQGQGAPVLLLHGIPTWSFLWERTIAALSPRYRVLAPDLLGYGYSAKRDDFDRSIARQAEMIDAFLTKLNLNSVHIVGHEIGGGIALRLAGLFPQRVRTLTLMNSVCYDSWPVGMMVQSGQPSSARRFAPGSTLKLLQKGLQTMFAQTPDRALVEGLLSPWRTEVGRLSLVRNAASLNTSHTTEITRLLPRIQAPTLLVWGEDDPHQPVHYAKLLTSDIPGANLVRVANARHFVMVDQPERVNGALQRFLEAHGEDKARPEDRQTMAHQPRASGT